MAKKIKRLVLAGFATILATFGTSPAGASFHKRVETLKSQPQVIEFFKTEAANLPHDQTELETDSALTRIAQWFNWPNWGNWNNWGNFGNVPRWGNGWDNFLNY